MGGVAARFVLAGALTLLIVRPVFAEPLALEVAEASVSFDQRTSEPVISVRFKLAAAQAFALFTQYNVGRKIDVRIDGKTMTSPRILDPILGGAIQIAGRFTTDEANEIAGRLSAGVSKLAVELAAN